MAVYFSEPFAHIDYMRMSGCVDDLSFTHFAEKTVSTHPGPPKLLFISRDFVLMALTAGLSVAIRVTGNWYRSETERKELEREHAEAELKKFEESVESALSFQYA